MKSTAIIAFVFLIACNGKSNHEDDSTPPTPGASIDALPKEKPLSVDAQTTQWKTHTIDELGLTFEIFADGDPPKESQGYWRQQHGAAYIGVMWGADAELEPLRQHFTATSDGPVAEPKPIQFCGRPALTLTIQTRDRGIVRGKTRRGEGIHTPHPARVHGVVAFERRGTPILVRWVVDLDAREAHRALEDHFFDSVTCTAEATDE